MRGKSFSIESTLPPPLLLLERLRSEFNHRQENRREMLKCGLRLDLPLTSSSSIVVLESVDSFSFTCEPSLFFVMMLLPYVGWGEEKDDYFNELRRREKAIMAIVDEIRVETYLRNF
jgi:hypothetical protein